MDDERGRWEHKYTIVSMKFSMLCVGVRTESDNFNDADFCMENSDPEKSLFRTYR